jgi:hypothetical protein
MPKSPQHFCLIQKNMNLPTTSILFNYKNLRNKKGLYSIHMRVTLERNSIFIKIPIPQKIAESDWNFKNHGIEFVKLQNPYSFEINCTISDYIQRVQEVVKRYYLQKSPLSLSIIKTEILGNKEKAVSFNNYVSNYIKKPTDKLEEGTLNKYKSFLAHLNKFNPKIEFAQITPDFVTKFKQFLEMK